MEKGKKEKKREMPISLNFLRDGWTGIYFEPTGGGDEKKEQSTYSSIHARKRCRYVPRYGELVGTFVGRHAGVRTRTRNIVCRERKKPVEM